MNRDQLITYSQGGCHYLALVAHDRLGWELWGAFGTGRGWRGAGDVIHIFVVTPDGERFDIFGLGDSPEEFRDQLQRERLTSGVKVIPLTPSDIDHLIGLGWLSAVAADDLTAAQPVLDQLIEDNELTTGVLAPHP